MDEPRRKLWRCAIYTRKSTEHNLDLEFNSLDAQREACEAYVKSQAHEGWRLIPTHYDDGAFSGASLDRPALRELLAELRSGKIDVIVVYKVDRLTRSLADFAKLVELFDRHCVSFVSVTQSFNTTSSMGRLTLNVLLSFAQFEREVIGERVRDKIAASKRKGIWVGGSIPLGYASINKKLIVVPEEAETVRLIFRRRSGYRTIEDVWNNNPCKRRQIQRMRYEMPRGTPEANARRLLENVLPTDYRLPCVRAIAICGKSRFERTAWLGPQDSNSEMSLSIHLKFHVNLPRDCGRLFARVRS